MSHSRREMRSLYMEFAKLRSHARFNLATSGIENFPLAELPVAIADLEISGPDGYGYAPLLERLAKRTGVPQECVVLAAGTSMANYLALASVVDPGDEVLIEQPAYEPLVTTAEYLGARVRRFARRFEDAFRIDPGEIERAITPATRLIVVTNMHNPSGVLIDDATLRRVGEIAARAGACVLVDEVYREMLFELPARTAFHLGENFMVTSSLTKAYGLSGLRCGWVLASPELAQRMWRINDFFGVIPAHAAERLSVVALDHLPMIAQRARKLLAANRALLDAFLDSRDDLQVVRPAFGTIIFPRLVSGRGEEFCQFLREKYETSVAPGHFFEMPDHFRVGVGGSTSGVAASLAQLSLALDDFGGKN